MAFKRERSTFASLLFATSMTFLPPFFGSSFPWCEDIIIACCQQGRFFNLWCERHGRMLPFFEC
ncbi:hypothetical protein IC582_029935 [Cucumis melo]